MCAILLCDATGGKEDFVNSINGNLKSIKFRRFIELPMPLIARWMTRTERTVIGLGNQKPCCWLEIKTAQIAKLLLHDKRLNRLQHDDNDDRKKICSRGIEQSTEYMCSKCNRVRVPQCTLSSRERNQPCDGVECIKMWNHKNPIGASCSVSAVVEPRDDVKKKSLQQQRIGEAWKNHSGRYFVFARLDSESREKKLQLLCIQLDSPSSMHFGCNLSILHRILSTTPPTTILCRICNL